MAVRLARPPGLVRVLWAGAAATVVGIASSLLIARRQRAAGSDGSDEPEPGGQVSDAESLRDGPTEIYPDQAVAGYPDSESGAPDEGPAGPNSRPDWQGPGTGA